MKNFNVRVGIVWILIVLAWTSAVTAQVSDVGFRSANRYAAMGIDSMNMTNGNLVLNIPIASLPTGRGGSPGYSISLQYNSKLWTSHAVTRDDGNPDEQGNTRFLYSTVGQTGSGGWRLASAFALRTLDRSNFETTDVCGTDHPVEQLAYRWKVEIEMPDGSIKTLIPTDQYGVPFTIYEDGYSNINSNGELFTAHRFTHPSSGICYTNEGWNPNYITTGMNYITTDGSRIRLVKSRYSENWKLYFPDGTMVENAPTDDTAVAQRMTDRNGNFVEHRGNRIVDQLGRYIEIESGPGATQKIRVKGVAGEILETQIDYEDRWVYHEYTTSTDQNAPNAYRTTTMTESLHGVKKIVFPSQAGSQEMNFDYYSDATQPTGESYTDGWGELKSVVLPTGAKSSYAYTEGDGTPPSIAQRYAWKKDLDYVEQYDGQSTPRKDTWQFEVTNTGNSVTQPNGASTTESVHYNLNDTGWWNTGLPYKTTNPDGSVVERIWAQNIPYNPTTGVPYPPSTRGVGSGNAYVKTEFTTLPDANGAISSNSLTAIKDYKFDKNGNVLEVKEYDWVSYGSVPRNGGVVTGLPSSGLTLKRKTVSSYYNQALDAESGSANGLSYNHPSSPKIKGILKSTEIQDGVGTPFSRSEFFYDHESNKGNITETRVWDSYKNGTFQAYSNPLTTTNSQSTKVLAYDSYGNPLLTEDARQIQTQITYGSIGGFTGLYPTQTVVAYGTPVARTSSAEYDLYTGLVTKATDVDNSVSSITEYDALGRTKKVRSAANTALESWTRTEYDDQNRIVVVRSDIEALGDGRKVSSQFYDELGRVRLSKTLEDALTQSATNEVDGIKVQTRYQSAGGYTFQVTSNPYRANYSAAETDATMGWTRSKGWNTGRRFEVETFSGATLPSPWGVNANSTGVVKTDIDANATTATDQAGKLLRSITNALGNLERVDEPNGSNQLGAVTSPNQPTSYSYDPLSNLLTVTQNGNGTEQCGAAGGSCSQTRTFIYSSLSRLVSAINPESGTIGYRYDSNGNLSRKIDAQGVQTDYVYDQLSRITNRNYSTPSGAPANYQASPNVTYLYDDPLIAKSKGKLTKVATGTGPNLSTTEYLSFDILGRVTRSSQTTDGITYGGGTDPNYWMTYSYNLSGALVEQQYPSGRRLRNELDSSGDLAQVDSKKNPNHAYWTYANHLSYNAAGAVTSMQLGNGRWESIQFNSRLQPAQIALGSVQNGTDKLKLDYQYGDLNWDGTVLPGTNNGNVAKQTIKVEAVGATPGFTAVQNYDYDSLNRIQISSETLTPTAGTPEYWVQEFQYDRYGNRTFKEATTTTLPKECNGNTEVCAAIRPVVNPSADPADNKLNGYTFDASGNTTKDAENRKFIYDAENKQVKVQTVDAGGNPTATVGEYWYDGDGKRVKKRGYKDGVLNEETIFVYDASGKLVGEFSNQVASSQTADVAYLTSDHLGSPRINTDVNGNVTARHDYHPFGDEIAGSRRSSSVGYSDDSLRRQFAGKERDDETSLDFSYARYFSSVAGRFSTADPMYISYGKIKAPQTWNLYVYAGNNPLAFTDPTGMERIRLGRKDSEIQKDLDDIKAKKKEIDNDPNKAQKQKKEEKAELDKSKNNLTMERDGNRMVQGMLDALPASERGNYQLSDFTLSTDPVNDLNGWGELQMNVGDPGRIADMAQTAAGKNMFILAGTKFSDTIFINTTRPNIKSALARGQNYIAFGATSIRHEEVHRGRGGNLSEFDAYTRQREVLEKMPEAFTDPRAYQEFRRYLTGEIEAARVAEGR